MLDTLPGIAQHPCLSLMDNQMTGKFPRFELPAVGLACEAGVNH